MTSSSFAVSLWPYFPFLGGFTLGEIDDATWVKFCVNWVNKFKSYIEKCLGNSF